MKFKLSAPFMLVMLSVVGFVLMTFGVSLQTALICAGFIVASAFFVKQGATTRHMAHRQFGRVGEDSDIEKEYKEVQSSLKKVNDQLKTFAEEAQQQIKSHAKLSEETKANVDKLLVTQGELQARLQASEQLLAKLESGGGDPAAPKSLGEHFINADGFEAFAQRGASGQKLSFSTNIKAAITSLDSSAGDLIVPQRLGMILPVTQRLFLRDLLSWGRTTSSSLEYVRETGFTNNADVVSENPSDPKPESDLTFELDSAPVATIAHWVRASRQVLADAAMLASYIDGRLRYGLKLKEEAQLLKGSGVGLNINGIYTQASTYSNPGVTVQAETAIDRLRIAMLQVTLAEYDADGIVLSPIDWTTIELSKTTDNAYLFATPRGLAAPGLWGRPVVATKAMDADDFLVGSFQQGAQGWDREDVSVTVSTEDRDNFVKNMVTILCEERVGLTVYRPEAFVKGDFTGLPVS